MLFARQSVASLQASQRTCRLLTRELELEALSRMLDEGRFNSQATWNLPSYIQVQVVLSEMSLQKELCLICERPTADGAILAVHVDKEKLQNWFLNVCEYELAEEIKDDDLICYFCLWHAEFQWKFDEMADEALVWWNLDLDDAARELRKKYFEGKLEQCWVQMEKIEIPKNGPSYINGDSRKTKKDLNYQQHSKSLHRRENGEKEDIFVVCETCKRRKSEATMTKHTRRCFPQTLKRIQY
ncbi:Hypothetical predicted protein [Cloeon dipterum]|uniref:Uncharacterized protein n=1 Tax=Cloeon dipterum TaxID=197152 RepID=A0A8S1DZV2_9INSE|nr:Hypothetical predicted protein [Cloeon dipterum]